MALIMDGLTPLEEWQWMVRAISLWQILAIIAYRNSQQVVSSSMQWVLKVKDLCSSIALCTLHSMLPITRYSYVTEENNFHVQVLNSDLTFSNSFGRKGSGRGQFVGIHGIACDSTENVYVVDADNHRIQLFTADGM